MNADSEPNWELLPANPAAFFGLPPGFNLRALRSRYSDLVRRYKPEHSPTEFRQIRSAFEALKRRFETGAAFFPDPSLLNGNPSGKHPETAPNSPPDTEGQPPITRDNQQESVTAGSRIRHHKTPLSAYEVYRDQAQKNPRDYYALALLSDLVDEETVGFAGWLLAGIAQHPRDNSLFALLRAYYATTRAARDAPRLLVSTADSMQDDRFYELTRPLWEALIRSADLATFQSLLEACEAKLIDDDGEQRRLFYLWLIKIAMWTKHSRWFEQRLATVDHFASGRKAWYERERDVVDRLFFYRDRRDRFRQRGPLCLAMDKALVDFLMHPDDEACRRLATCQALVADSAPQVQREFPCGPSERDHAVSSFAAIWQDVSAHAAARLEIPKLSPPDDAATLVEKLTGQLMHRGRRCGFQAALWGLSVLKIGVGLAFTLLGAFCLLLAVALVRFATTLPQYELLLAAFIVAAMIFPSYLLARHVPESLNSWRGVICTRYYRWVWRAQLFDFLARNRLRLSHLREELTRLNRQSVDGLQVRGADQVDHLIASDVGLMLFEIASEFPPAPLGRSATEPAPVV